MRFPVPTLTVGLFVLPLVVGLLGTWLPAFGWLPSLGGEGFSLEPWRVLFAHPSLPGAVRLTLISGLVSSFLSLALVLCLACAWHERRLFRALAALTPGMLAAPHAALAVGLGFLIAPSGFAFRAVHSVFGAPELPPQLATVQDGYGLALAAGLFLKEFPFLLLMLLAVSGDSILQERLRLARSLGYGCAAAWWKVGLPTLWPRLRLPFFAVLAYSLSVVDMALILGPQNPPTLAVLVLRLFYDPNLQLRFAAAAGATLQLGLVGGLLLAWLLFERVARARGRVVAADGHRLRQMDAPLRLVSGTLACGALGVGFVSLALLGLWSFADTWRWPALAPDAWTTEAWVRLAQPLGEATFNTFVLGMAASFVALVLTVLCLENETRTRRNLSERGLWLLYLPLLLPQIAFLFGIQVVVARLHLEHGFLILLWSHFLFVLPYSFLALSGPWRAVDTRYGTVASTLGRGPWFVFLRLRCLLLLRPLGIAFAIGFAVSTSLYLPTLLLGGGRTPTLALEAVAAAGGAGRRTVGVWAGLQALLPLTLFVCAVSVPVRGVARSRSFPRLRAAVAS